MTSAPGLIVIGLMLWTLLSPKSSVVFSPEYREYVARTWWTR